MLISHNDDLFVFVLYSHNQSMTPTQEHTHTKSQYRFRNRNELMIFANMFNIIPCINLCFLACTNKRMIAKVSKSQLSKNGYNLFFKRMTNAIHLHSSFFWEAN